jgi:hypothetical protein
MGVGNLPVRVRPVPLPKGPRPKRLPMAFLRWDDVPRPYPASDRLRSKGAVSGVPGSAISEASNGD